MRNFILGFCSCLAIAIFMGMTPPLNIENNEMANIYSYIEKPNFKIFTSTPNDKSLIDGQGVWLYTNQNMYWYTKKGTNTYQALMTKN